MAETTATATRPATIPNRPRMAVVIEHIDQAQAHMQQASRVLSTMILDLEQGADFCGRFRDGLIKSIQDAGGDVDASIEHQIAEFIPRKHRQTTEGE